MIIVVGGYRGSGKSLFGEVARNMGFPVLEMSEPILELMKERGLEITNESVRNFATDFREKEGADGVAKLLLPKVKLALAHNPTVIIIGARSEAEVKAFSTLGPTLLVAIISNEKKRFERVRARGKTSDPQKIEDFRWADEVEAKWGLAQLLEHADVQLENNSTQHEFVEKVKAFLAKHR